MTNSIPIVRQLLSDAINRDNSVSTLLRTAKIVAVKLDLPDALKWIDRELDGYMGLFVEEFPPYRRLKGILQGRNQYHDWQPIRFGNPEHEQDFSQAPIDSPIGAIEEGLKRKHKGDIEFNMHPERKSQLFNALSHRPAAIRLKLSHEAMFAIVDAVRNLILNWSLELEKVGILGESMEFSRKDKKEAAPISQQVFAQNIGVVGNVSGQARVVNEQAATMMVNLDVASVQDFAAQARQDLPLLPEDSRSQLAPALTELDEELTREPPQQSRLRELLGSVRSVCEGATGNLAAQGILGMLNGLL